MNFSKWLLAAAILSCVKLVGMALLLPAMMTMMYVLPVKASIKALKCLLRTSMP